MPHEFHLFSFAFLLDSDFCILYSSVKSQRFTRGILLNRFKPLRCTVGPETARMLNLGHPWVIADRYTSRWPKAESGSLVELVTEKQHSLGTALYDPGARIVARSLSRAVVEVDRGWYVACLERAARSRSWIDFGDTDVTRLVNAEGDGLPGLTVDRYADYLMLQYYTKAWERHLPTIVTALQEVYAPAGVYVKFRPQETRKLTTGKQKVPVHGRLLAGAAAPNDLSVRENGLSYHVDLVKDLNTGLFHDQRLNRLEFRRLSANCRVLNLFAYTGAFSVAAAAGGAQQVTSVDVSGRYLEWARNNFRLNQIDVESHEFLTGDCFSELDRLQNSGRQYDIVLIDPPSFSTTRKSRFTTSGGTAELVQKSLGALKAGGLLVASSNLQKMPLESYLKELRKGSLAAGYRLQVIKVAGQAEDFPFLTTFPEGNYLKYVVSVVQEKL
jgi:23S rRNA (cytosine1962-C5)-methyltransferase